MYVYEYAVDGRTVQLYDKGYTSLGCTETTVPNKALRYKDIFGKDAYRAAYTLEDESLERLCRVASVKDLKLEEQQDATDRSLDT